MNTLRSTVSGMKLTDLALAALATGRLMRLLSQDMIGEWTIVRPIKAWATKYEWPRYAAEIAYRRKVAEQNRREELSDVPLPNDVTRRSMIKQSGDEAEQAYRESYDEKDPYTWQAKLASGLECPFCAGFWVGAAVLGSLLVARRFPTLLPVWRFAAGTLALNYCTAHVSSRLDA